MPRSSTAEFRRSVYELLEQGPVGARRTRIVSRILILLIIVNLIAVVGFLILAISVVPAVLYLGTQKSDSGPERK